jgi:hypothetical protein
MVKKYLLLLCKKLLNILFRFLDFIKFDFDRFNKYYFNFLIKREELNISLINNRDNNSSSGYFIQSIPDRYSANIDLYKQKTGFLNFKDLEKWLSGNYNNNIIDINRYFFINLCIDYLIEEKLNGNVAEVGVYKGNSAFLLRKFAQTQNKLCYLFDTYESFDSRDLVGKDINTAHDAFNDTSLEMVKKLVGEKNTVYVKGYFPESLNQIEEINDLILVHIDCDLEKPIFSALKYFYPRILKGGFLIMHDHSSLYWPGAQSAIDEFFNDKIEHIIPIPDKSGTCVIRKA